jgi:hypothetical protein
MFNNDLASDGVGLLEEIHIFLNTGSETMKPIVPIQTIAHKLGLLFLPFPRFVITTDIAFSTPVFETADKIISYEEVRRERMEHVFEHRSAPSEIMFPFDAYNMSAEGSSPSGGDTMQSADGVVGNNTSINRNDKEKGMNKLTEEQDSGKDQ